MTALLALIAPLKRYAEIGILLALIAGGVWVYFAMVHRADEIRDLTIENGTLTQANADGVKTAQAVQERLDRTTAALTAEKQAATDNAALGGQLQERISHAPKNGCIGPAMRGVLDGLRADSSHRGSAIRPAASP